MSEWSWGSQESQVTLTQAEWGAMTFDYLMHQCSFYILKLNYASQALFVLIKQKQLSLLTQRVMTAAAAWGSLPVSPWFSINHVPLQSWPEGHTQAHGIRGGKAKSFLENFPSLGADPGASIHSLHFLEQNIETVKSTGQVVPSRWGQCAVPSEQAKPVRLGTPRDTLHLNTLGLRN